LIWCLLHGLALSGLAISASPFRLRHARWQCSVFGVQNQANLFAFKICNCTDVLRNVNTGPRCHYVLLILFYGWFAFLSLLFSFLTKWTQVQARKYAFKYANLRICFSL